MTNLNYIIDENIAIISFDMPNRSMNLLTRDSMAEFGDYVNQAINDENVKSIIITSGKKDFLGGVDLSLLEGLCNPYSKTSVSDRAKNGYDLIISFHKILRKLETSKKPVICAITGTCMGGGFEIALACHYRIAGDNDKAQIGLPECKIGLMPGFGGTQRLTRLVGMAGASEALLTGKSYSPLKAKAAGFIHDVVPSKKLLDAAKKWAKNAVLGDAVQPWDKADYKIKGGGIYHPSGMQNFIAGNAMTLAKTGGNYIAQEHILSAIYEGLQVTFEEAMEIEVTHFVYLMTQPQSFNMIRTLFLSKQALDKGARRPKDITISKYKYIAVIGAGMMGAGIAHSLAVAGVKVFLLDISIDKAEQGKGHIIKLILDAAKKGRFTQKQVETIMANIFAGTDFEVLKQCDIVIEAVFEDIKVKEETLRKIESFTHSKCIIASNTSSLPIGDLAEFLTYKKNFIGIHFFSPVDKMPLVEVIMGSKTGDRALAKALDLVRLIKKTPIVVSDARFFYANRCIIPYIEEAHIMITEGIDPVLIENAALSLGFPVGPLLLNDEVSLDLSLYLQNATAAALGDKYMPSPSNDLVKKMLNKKRHGKKSGGGFYNYDNNDKAIWSGLADLYPLNKVQPDISEVKKRLLNIQLIQVITAIEDKVITDIRDADVGAIFGWGFPAYTGGPVSYIDTIGTGFFLRECEKMAKIYGKRFSPPKILREMGRGGERFYIRFMP